jgi:DNA-directed RNA polymerase subunit beta
MTEKGTFIINGTSVWLFRIYPLPGVYLKLRLTAQAGQRLAMAKMIPDRGAGMDLKHARLITSF